MFFTSAGLSKKGGRQENQDYFDYTQVDKFHCWVIADGLGGHIGGKKASETAVKTIIQEFVNNPGIKEDNIRKYISIVQDKINEIKDSDENFRDMKTTIVLAISDGKIIRFCHIGDTRLYFLKNGKIIFRTIDHSIAQTLVNIGNITEEEVLNHPARHKLVYVLGDEMGESLNNIEVKDFPINDNDAILMCTDGVWEFLAEDEIEIEYSKSKDPKEWISYIEKRILSKIYSINKRNDNYTLIAAFFNNE